MENASLIGLSRQVALRRELDIIANNVANMSTAGFKSDEMVFSEFVSPKARDNTFQRPLDRPLSFVEDIGTVSNFAPGELQTTGAETDVAIDGKGFFVVQTPEGPRYTRGGAFKTDATGTLVTNTGYPVLSNAGPIRFGPTERDITFSQDGTIATSEGVRGRLQVVEFESYAGVRKDGVGLFSSTATPRAAVTETRIVQGAIEKSNVRPVLEMSRMIEVNRSYTNISGLLDKQDEIRRSAIERLADVPA